MFYQNKWHAIIVIITQFAQLFHTCQICATLRELTKLLLLALRINWYVIPQDQVDARRNSAQKCSTWRSTTRLICIKVGAGEFAQGYSASSTVMPTYKSSSVIEALSFCRCINRQPVALPIRDSTVAIRTLKFTEQEAVKREELRRLWKSTAQTPLLQMSSLAL